MHSTFSDDAVSSLADNVAAARVAGLTSIRLVDHVWAGTTWVPEFLAATADLTEDAAGTLQILTGVEAKILDGTGTLDVPAGLVVGPGGVDRILIADHQFPGPDGPWTPATTLSRRASGLATADVVDMLVTAMIGAMRAAGRGQLAHPFSLLPKIGLTESDVTDQHLYDLAQAAGQTDTAVEVNEKWGCPSPRTIAAFRQAGVAVVAATDSHHSRDVGRYARVQDLLAAADRVGTDAPCPPAAAGPRR